MPGRESFPAVDAAAGGLLDSCPAPLWRRDAKAGVLCASFPVPLPCSVAMCGASAVPAEDPMSKQRIHTSFPSARSGMVLVKA